MFYCLIRLKQNFWSELQRSIFGKKFSTTNDPAKTIITVNHGGGSIMHWGFFAAGGTGNIDKAHVIMNSNNILKLLEKKFVPQPLRQYMAIVSDTYRLIILNIVQNNDQEMVPEQHD